MKYLAVAVFCLLALSKCGADELDDLRAKALEDLTAIFDRADRKVKDGLAYIDDTQLYIERAVETFTANAATNAENNKNIITTNADELTTQAIINNKPAKVITCIATERDNGYAKISGVLSTFTSNINVAAAKNTADFPQQVSSIQLIQGQLTTIFNNNADNINLCVLQDCFANNLATATQQFDNVISSVDTIVGTVKGERNSFDKTASSELATDRENTVSEKDAAVKAMGKC